MSPLAVGADMSPHNLTNLIDSFGITYPDGTSGSKGDCSNCHDANYTSKCDQCHTNTSGGGFGNMVGWDNLHNYVTDSAPAMATHRDLACGDCHMPVTHGSLTGIVNNKLVTGVFSASSVVNTLMSTETWMPDPAVWKDSNGAPGNGVVQEQWTSTLTISSGYSVLAPDWTDPSLWMEKTGPERGLILGILNTAGTAFDDDHGSFEVIDAVANGDNTVTLTVKGKVVLAGLYQVDQTTPSFALYYYQMTKPFIGYCDDPAQPGDQIDAANPQICFDLMGGNLYGSSNCPDDLNSPDPANPGKYFPVKCIRQDVIFTGPADFAKNDGLAAGGNDSTPNGICQVCHLNTSHWRRDGSQGDHYNGQQCTNCHDHTTGFQPNCTLCHAMPPVDNGGMVHDPSATGSVTAGAHALHATPAGFDFACDMCHAGGMPDSSISGNNKIQIGFGVNPASIPSSYDGQANLAAPYSYEGTGDTTVTAGSSLTCANVYCHSNGAYISTGKFNSHVTPSWNTDGPLGCDSCHPYPMATGADDPRKNTHGVHTSKGFGDCGLCHYANSLNHKLHSNKVYDVDPAPTFQGRPADGAVPLSFTYSFAPGGGTCSSNSCHAYWGYSDPAKWGVNTDLVVIPYLSGLSSLDTDRTVTFDASRSACYENVNGVPVERTCSYTWDFGGSGSVTGGNGSDVMIYQYGAEGTYTASVTLREQVTGKSATETVTVIAENVAPPPASADFATSVAARTVTLTATLPPEVVRLYAYWGDGKRTIYANPATDVMSHVYTVGGRSYDIKVSTYDVGHNKVDYTVVQDADLHVTLP
jgi:predicted CxxxxCH...CXXCH cytochrome family protein